MITTDNLKQTLTFLGFNEKNDVFTKHFNISDCDVKVDFTKNEICYPENSNDETHNGMIINDRTTCNFSHPENFVVLECVCRLLEQGYRPEHIELEPRWTLGHNQKSGKADILVYNADRSEVLILIECKTAGDEYRKAKKLLTEDGGQLFSYWQQEKSTQWLCLYASNFENDAVTYKNEIIRSHDDANFLKLAEKDESILLYKNANKVEELFEAWTETYHSEFIASDIIFGNDTTAYNIGVAPLRKKELKDFSPNDKIVNRFEEILRHNNVSDKENAFNRLIALFICKLVDEMTKTDDDIVDFQYKTGTDTYERLQDRLMRLHQKGMKDFMGEEIFYVEDNYAENLFAQQLNAQNRRNAIEELNKTIRILKFYSNNDFSFKDVHNEELFYQNGKILVEVVQLFEKYRIIYNAKHQFLGDLFEQLLNKGFKQNEGQFFTPMPITHFIWASLPLDRFAAEKPKVIDYACGAGHFLTEGISVLNTLNPSDDDNAWVKEKIFGIEKDYRLARVSKVSLFMNGAGCGNIIFGDGLENYKDKQIISGSFDILVANPPYSVDAFKAHLKLKNNRFDIWEKLSNNASEIETLFVERIPQLLKPKGIAAVVLPSSILSNDSGSYVAAREKVLENCYIHAIVQFGSKTFGATGTNTVVLFLEKFDEPPTRLNMVQDSVNNILDNGNRQTWEDEPIFAAYTTQIGVTAETYSSFIAQTADLDTLQQTDYFEQYITWFNALTSTKKLKDSNNFKKLAAEEKQQKLTDEFFKVVKRIEREKLTYFALVYQQNTLVVTAPQDNAKQKEFLGYDWSNRKGNEGIQMNKEGGMLYNPNNLSDPDCINVAVRNSYGDDASNIAVTNEYASLFRLADMLDFSRSTFNKAIKLSVDKKVEIKSKWEMVRLGEVCSEIESGSRPKGGVSGIKEGVLSLGGEHIDNFSGYLNLATPKYVTQAFYNAATSGKIKENDVLLCKDGALTGKIAIVRNELENLQAMINEHVFILRCDNLIKQQYLFEYLYSERGQIQLKAEITGSAQGGLNSTNLKQIRIPLPPLNIQQEIVTACQDIDSESQAAQNSIAAKRKEVEAVVNAVSGEMITLKQLCETNPSKLAISKLPDDTIVSFVEMASVSNNGHIETKIDKPLKDLRKGSYTYFAENDIIIAKITPCMENGKCGIAKGLTNNIALGSSEFHVFRCSERINNVFLFHYLNREIIRQEAARNMTGASGHRRVPIEFYENFQIPVPALSVQREIVAKVTALEAEIAAAEKIVAGADERKKKVLEEML